MSFDDLQQVWSSPHNRPTADQMEKDRIEFVKDLQRRRRGTRIFLGFIFAVLTVLTTLLVKQIIRPDPSMDSIDPTREWGAAVFLLLPWIAAIAFARLQLRHGRTHRHPERSISGSVRALLEENANERRRYQIVAGLNLAMLGLVPVVVQQLRAVGKAGDEILIPAFVIFPALMALVFFGMGFRYWKKLVPEQRRLAALLQSYQNART